MPNQIKSENWKDNLAPIEVTRWLQTMTFFAIFIHFPSVCKATRNHSSHFHIFFWEPTAPRSVFQKFFLFRREQGAFFVGRAGIQVNALANGACDKFTSDAVAGRFGRGRFGRQLEASYDTRYGFTSYVFVDFGGMVMCILKGFNWMFTRGWGPTAILSIADTWDTQGSDG